ncbi:MAG: GYF domain-containing protein [Candidatus Udaeobacter sp.]
MLDSGCMMQDDQGMTEEWIVRVQGKEYGPADIDTLREWKREGRLLPENEARDAGADLWSTAAAIPGLFDLHAVAEPSVRPTPPLPQHRGFGQILAETFQIYRKGFFQFLGLTLLVLLPSVCSQLTTALVQRAHGSDGDLRVLAGDAFAFLMFVLSIAMWPVYVAGIQILTAEIAGGRRPGLIAALNEAVRFWPRVAALCIFVYGVFALLMLFGLVIAAIALAGTASLLLVLFAMALLILQVWMFGRFFVNVLFWEQFAVLENAAFIDALRDSRNLAYSGRDLPWFQRPLWRGAFLASLWFAFVLAVTLASEWTTLHHYLNEFATTQNAQTLLQQLTEAQQARGFDISAFVPNLLQRILQPLLGIAFVLLYFDSKK